MIHPGFEADTALRLEIVSLVHKPGLDWDLVQGNADKVLAWVKQGTPSGPASAEAAPTPGDTGGSGPGVTPGQAAQRNQTSRNNPTGRA